MTSDFFLEEADEVHLIFGQTGNIYIKDGVEYKIRNGTYQMAQALKSGLRYPPADIEVEIQSIYDLKEKIRFVFIELLAICTTKTTAD